MGEYRTCCRHVAGGGGRGSAGLVAVCDMSGHANNARCLLRDTTMRWTERSKSARRRLQQQRYECLGCNPCFPAVALNDLAADGSLNLAEAAACPTDAIQQRQGWPPLPGSYTVLRYHAPVVVCYFNDEALARTVAAARLSELAVVGTLHTENFAIGRTISDVVANPHIRFVVVCGSDSRQAIGHLPGQSLVALAQCGEDDRQRIIGAKGKRPILRNLDIAAIEHFRSTREVIDLIGVWTSKLTSLRASLCRP